LDECGQRWSLLTIRDPEAGAVRALDFDFRGDQGPRLGSDFDKRWRLRRLGETRGLAVGAAPPFEGVRFKPEVAGHAGRG
jgi:hypothetical protein